jgi:tetratricopeptide (TPR) repeat protein
MWAQGGRARALVIGVRRYPRYAATKPLQFSDRDASLFSEYLTKSKPGAFQKEDLVVIRDEEATLDRVTLALRRTLLGAEPGDTVYIFFSARGVALPGAPDGYLGTSDLVEIKPESTGFPVSDLKDLMQYSRAQRIFFFADLCRDPPSMTVENRINIRLEDLGTIGKVSGILGSERQRLSLEKPDLHHAQESGFGVFGYSLVSGLEKPQNGHFFEQLKREMALTTGSYRQSPTLLGTQPALERILQVIGVTRLLRGPLWASLAWSPEVPPSSQETDPAEISRQLTSGGLIREPEQLVARTLAYKASLPDSTWQQVRDSVSGMLAGDAQKLIAEYGVLDLLPEDPDRPGKGDRSFAWAARAFAGVLALVPDEPTYTTYRQDVESRRLLCSGLDQIYQDRAAAGRPDLQRAESLARRPAPEIYNALGITFLEAGPDYNRAAQYFRSAKRLSPMWPYPRHNLALTYAESGDYTGAEKEYADAIAIAPDQPYLYYNLGLLYERSNQKRLARSAYEGALQSLTRQAAIYDMRGREWAGDLPREGDVARRRAVAAGKTTAVVQNALGSLLESERNPREAAAHYEEAMRIDPSLCVARHNLALLKQKWPRKKFSDTATAADLYRDNAGRCPAFWPSILQLAKIDLAQGDLSRAGTELHTVLSLAPSNREAKKTLAAVSIGQNDAAGAIALLTAVISEDVRQSTSNRGLADPALYELLGDAYTVAKDSRACEAYRSALAATKGAAYGGDRGRLRRKASCR